MNMNEIHQRHWHEYLDDAQRAALYASWWETDRVNHWRHLRLMAPVIEVLGRFGGFSWLTVGDGAGMDAWIMHRAGFVDVLATDLDDTVLAETRRRSHIANYRIENAEALSFPDGHFDFVLCKEALHHMSRPYAAIYECLRVARYGVVLVEPQDPWIDWPHRTDAPSAHYEAVGNFVYTFSARELEKIGYGMNLRGLATRALVDVYIEGCEYARRAEDDPLWRDTREQLAALEAAVAAGTAKPNYLQAILFKNAVDGGVLDWLRAAHPTWTFQRTDTNPYLTP